MSDDNDVKLSPEDIERCRQALRSISDAKGRLDDISDDVKEEYGDLEDAVSKLEEADELLSGVIPDDGEATGDKTA